MSPRQADELATWLCLPMAFGLAWVACGMRLVMGETQTGRNLS